MISTLIDPGHYLSKFLRGLHGKAPMDMSRRLDFTLDDSAMARMEITLASMIDPGYALVVRDLVEKHFSEASVRQSTIKLSGNPSWYRKTQTFRFTVPIRVTTHLVGARTRFPSMRYVY